MYGKILALTILALALFTGTAITTEMLTLDQDAIQTPACAGSNC